MLKVRKRLIDLDMNQRSLAAKAGLSKSYISQLLKGKRTLSDDIKQRIMTALEKGA